MNGIFVTIEGPEGSGKSTQARLLAERLIAEGRDVVLTREPGGTPTGEAIRAILQHDAAGEPIAPECEVLLFEACRAQLVAQAILPAIERGACVICDRFFDSTTAYQGYGRGLNILLIQAVNEFAARNMRPDLTLLLDLDPAAGLARAGTRNARERREHDRIEREEIAFHERVRSGYLALAASEPDRFRLIDAARDPESVANDIWNAVNAVLEERLEA